jgi:hypothetical protein
MANGRGGAASKKNPVSVSGPWFAMPLDFLRSRAWCELSPHAAKMLLDLCASLGPNAKGNGDLSAAPSIMGPKGWGSTATRRAALQELEHAGLVAVTRCGNRRACTLYAVTLWPLQCDTSKLDHGPGSFTTTDWQRVSADRAERPTSAAPAKWKGLRANEFSAPTTGQHPADKRPTRDNPSRPNGRCMPSTGAMPVVLPEGLIPPRDTFLDLPSAAAVSPVH